MMTVGLIGAVLRRSIEMERRFILTQTQLSEVRSTLQEKDTPIGSALPKFATWNI